MSRAFHVAIPTFLLLLIATVSAWAQFAQRGGIEGTVFDPSGAVVPGAQITLRDIAQNQSREMKTDAMGHFEFDNLTAGQYQLTAVMQGFQTDVSNPVAVNIGGVSHYDFKLHAGAVQQSVTVSGETRGLETDRISLDTDISSRQLSDLPLNGRNFTSITALAPGVSTYPQPNINPGGTYSVGAMFTMGGTQITAGGAAEQCRQVQRYLRDQTELEFLLQRADRAVPASVQQGTPVYEQLHLGQDGFRLSLGQHPGE
ncbi:MAG: carboxypeptidase regulatory-like domain-containing protein [Acidobacteriaceae bacterium]